MTLSKYQVAVFQPNGMLEFWDSKEFDTREAANEHLSNIQSKYALHMAVVKR